MKTVKLALMMLCFVSCVREEGIIKIEVSETAGIERLLEYVEVHWASNDNSAKDKNYSISDGNQILQGQVLSISEPEQGQYQIRAIFPVSLKANQSKKYTIISAVSETKDTLIVEGSGFDVTIANANYKADLTTNEINPDQIYAPGQVRGLLLKKHAHQQLKRTNINMHWSPNFQSSGKGYQTSSHLIKPDSVYIKKGKLNTILYKEGSVESYPEIKIKTKYEFFAGLPYFVYSSEVYMIEDIELFLLRNDEMTMDSLFTHIIFRDQTHGLGGEKLLYEENMVKNFAQDPIDDHAQWLAFYNKHYGYGLGSVRIEYDNTNKDGIPSPLYQPHSKISDGSNGGKYWNRRLIHEHDTLVKAGSRYYEKNAYVILSSTENIANKLDTIHKKIMYPVEVVVLNPNGIIN